MSPSEEEYLAAAVAARMSVAEILVLDEEGNPLAVLKNSLAQPLEFEGKVLHKGTIGDVLLYGKYLMEVTAVTRNVNAGDNLHITHRVIIE